VRSDVGYVIGVGVAAGALEAAVRASPARGFGAAQSLAFVALSVALGVLAAGGAGTVATLVRQAPRRRMFTVAALAALHAAVWWRYDHALNESLRDPRVFLGIPAAFVIGGALGAFVSRWLTVSRLAIWGAAALVVAGGRGQSVHGAKGGGPSVLVVSMDTARADHMGDKPTWARLVREGTSFTQAIGAAPITEPSHLAMLTGVAPFRSGVVSNGTALGDRPLVWKELRAAGWVTAGFVAGFPLHGKYGWGQGMDVWDDDFGAWPGAESLSLVKAWDQVALKEHALRERSADRVLAHAERWLGDHRDERFFAFVHFYDAHGPYHPHDEAALGAPPTDGAALSLPPYWPARDRAVTSTDWLSRAYDAEVQDVDVAVGRVLAALGDRLDDTIVVVTADHGESLTEHGYLFDHGDDLYDPSLRVPLVVRWPGHVGAGVALDCQVGGVDVAPTIRELVGVAAPDGVTFDGVSRVPELSGKGCRETPVVSSTTAARFVATPPVDHALRGAGSKLILKDAAGAAPKALFFDLLADPGELTPQPAPAVRVDLLRKLLSGGTASVAAEDDAETRAAMEALGYLEHETP